MDSGEAKRQIALKAKRMVGYDIVGLSDILSMLTGPDLLSDLENLIEIVKTEES